MGLEDQKGPAWDVRKAKELVLYDIDDLPEEWDFESVELFKKSIGNQHTLSAGLGAKNKFDHVVKFVGISVEDINRERIAHFIFYLSEENINLDHRDVNENLAGISGATMLHEGEAALRQLVEAGVITPKPLMLNAGQVSVIKWAIKNGFTFEKSTDSQLFDDIITGKNNEYVVVDAKDSRKKVGQSYIVSRKEFEDNPDHMVLSAIPNLSLRFNLSKEFNDPTDK